KKFLFYFIGQPVYFFLIADVFKFYTHMRGIAFFQVVVNIAEGGSAKANQVAGMKYFIKIGFSKAIETYFNIGAPVFAGAYGVCFGQQVPLIPVAQYHTVGPYLVHPVGRCSAGGWRG